MKILIVEDQTSIQFQLVAQLQASLKIINSDIKIASNGFEALAAIEKDSFDLVLMDLKMPVMDGLAATKHIVSEYSHIKVIIITSSNDRVVLRQLMDAGAKGYLIKANIISNLIATIENVINGYTVFPEFNPEDNTLLPFNSDVYIGSDILHDPPKFDESDMNKLIAANVVREWIWNEPDENLTQRSFFDSFEPNLNKRQNIINFVIKGELLDCDLTKELDLRFSHLVKKYADNSAANENLESKLDILANQLNFWLFAENSSGSFVCIKSRLETNAQVLRINLAEKLKQYLSLLLPKLSLMPSLEYLELIEKSLGVCINEHQNELNMYESQRKSALQAYSKLLSNYRHLDDLESRHKLFDSLCRALLLAYQAKISIEASSLAAQAIEGIVRTLQFYIDDVIQANSLLKSTHSQLGAFKIDEDIQSIIQYSLETRKNSYELLQEIEKEFGCSIHQWGIKHHITSSFLADKLITKISANSTTPLIL